MAEKEESWSSGDLQEEEELWSSHSSGYLVEPVTDLLRITLRLGHATPTDVYGTIIVHDATGTESCEVFSRPKIDPQLVTPSSNTLKFTGPGDRIFFMMKPVIRFKLINGADDSILIDDSRPIEKNDSVDFFERYDYFQLENPNTDCVVHVFYTALSFGVVAKVKVKLMRGDGSDGIAYVGGRICTRLQNVYSGVKNTYESDYADCRTLFHRETSESEKVTMGSAITLSRNYVAVPIYSNLVVEVDLKDGEDLIVSENFTFTPSDANSDFGESKPLGLGGVSAHIQVKWCNPSWLIDKVQGKERNASYVRSLERLPSTGIIGKPLVEIFSIVIGPKTDKTVSLYGMVGIRGPPLKTMFSANVNESFPVGSKHKLLPISGLGPHDVLEAIDSYFHIDVDLRNSGGSTSGGSIRILGCVPSLDDLVRGDSSWFDRRLCSVVRGENAFMALHYMAYESAIHAEIKVEVTCKSSDVLMVWGDVVASHSNQEYRTEYEKKCYRSCLFTAFRQDATKLKDSTLPLSRSSIPVSIHSTLIVHMNILASSDTSSPSSTEKLCGRLRFPIGKGAPVSKRIDTKSYIARVHVKWWSMS